MKLKQQVPSPKVRGGLLHSGASASALLVWNLKAVRNEIMSAKNQLIELSQKYPQKAALKIGRLRPKKVKISFSGRFFSKKIFGKKGHNDIINVDF